MKNYKDQIAAENFSSYPADKYAADFISKLANNQFVIKILPNNYTDFTGEKEFSDYKNYCALLKSRAGLRYVKNLI